MIKKACFGAGCFWGVEYVFKKFPGILKAKVGYMGGSLKNPSYEEVCSDKTGHAEVVYLEFDEKKISYNKLLEIFFKCHDPTTLDKQGPDFGSQYRSVIFYYDLEQKKSALDFIEKYQKELGKKIVTKVEKVKEFYEAEKYHQNYYEKKGSVPYCHIVPRIKV
jgi:methionine-S-sulfoxide reductase